DFDLPSFWQAHVQEFIETLSEYTFTLRLHNSRLSFARWLTPGRCDILEPEGGDGWLTARFRLESMDLARMLVFGLGTQAVVVEPRTLYESVLASAQEIVQKAGSNDPRVARTS